MTDLSTEQLTLALYGEVQGVGFRAFTSRVARRLGLVGFVENLDDGSVKAVAEGPGAKLEQFLAACKKGPAGATVERCVKTRRNATGKFIGFEVRR